MKLIPVTDREALSIRAAEMVAEKVQEQPDSVLGLATGGTPEGTYQQLKKIYDHGEADFSRITTFNLDEYAGMPKDHPQSYHTYMQHKVFQPLQLKPEQVHLPDGSAADLEQECTRYEKRIAETGGIDMQLLGLGENGHIGFNEPGTSFSSRTHVVQLKPSTREANARYFDSIEEVPQQAVTMGIETITDSRAILLLVFGRRKKEALLRLLEGEVDEGFPASVLKKHSNVTVIADEEALTDVSAEVMRHFTG
ncbi:glucosamine-6-phosphate deaminase [Marinococcus halophilus]|uniref:Glucosamine-6-phosphate deaminase n=1 Tax=Marinococcus halophilus TaxID=1371 RepID=A0A510Y373_MARHA|nr:glucosamine-6-phosphate deaminase [Marinococcus halophilus]OZT81805.1 glucosamine-6-phosphate deaminase [Marinococcus halophilus]GEK57769.1 glucosamine-6-phosphate deaminase 1 [Marinococcus halophilus]